MTIRVALHHETRYRYDRRVSLSPQIIRLRPAPHSRTPVPSYTLHIEPREHFLNWQQDTFGNFQARVVFPDKVGEFLVRVDLVAEMAVYNPFDFFLEESAEHYPFAYDALTRKDLEPYLVTEPVGPRLESWLADNGAPVRQPLVDFLVDLNQASPTRSGTSSAWSPASRRPRRPWRSDAAPAATRLGCWRRSAAPSRHRERASSPAT